MHTKELYGSSPLSETTHYGWLMPARNRWPTMNETYGPYSPVRQAGDYYFISGQVGVNPATKQAAAGIAEQTHQALTNLQAVLQPAGLSLEDVVKTTVFLTNMEHFTEVNSVYVEHFTSVPRPARSCVGVAKLPNVAHNELLVEIEAVAYKQKEVQAA